MTPFDSTMVQAGNAPGMEQAAAEHFRTLFFSDLHLGSVGSKAEMFLACLQQLTVLKRNKPEKIYIVGDFVELLVKVKFRDADIAVISRLIDLANNGIEIRIIKGNHDQNIVAFAKSAKEVTDDEYDQAMRQSLRQLFKNVNVKVRNKRTHTTIDGQGYRITHGHEFDPIIRAGNFFGLWGSTASKTLCEKLDCRGTRLKEPLFMLSSWIARRITNKFSLAKFINNIGFGGKFILPTLVLASLESTNDRIEHDARLGISIGRDTPYAGHVVGHEHFPRIMQRGKLSYINIGDFVGNDTFAAELQDGSIVLRRWTDKGVRPFANPIHRIPAKVNAKYINCVPGRFSSATPA